MQWKRLSRSLTRRVEDRIPEFEEKIEELNHSVKVNDNLKKNPGRTLKLFVIYTTGLEEGEFYTKQIGNTFNKIIEEIVPNLKRELPIQIQMTQKH